MKNNLNYLFFVIFTLLGTLSLGYQVATPNVWVEHNEPNRRPFEDSGMSYQYILNHVIVGKYHEVRLKEDGTEVLHNGVDYALPKNTPILATGGGVVMYAEWCEGYGNLIMINHGDGVVTMYAHLQRYNVLQGAKIVRGDVIGFVGSTGITQGNHVHWELRLNNEPIFTGRYINAKKRRLAQ